jgi:hypothetical protein
MYTIIETMQLTSTSDASTKFYKHVKKLETATKLVQKRNAMFTNQVLGIKYHIITYVK